MSVGNLVSGIQSRPTVIAIALCITVTAGSGLSAQRVAGRALGAGDGRPMVGVFVLLIDSVGAEIDRTLTDGLGRFQLRGPRPGTYRLKSAVVGLHSAVSEEFVLTLDSEFSVDLEIPERPVLLDPVVVTGERRCRIRAEAGEPLLVMWEEVRKGLEAVVWSARAPASRFRLVRYRRARDVSDSRVFADSLWTMDVRSSTPPYRTAQPESLASRGYVWRAPDGDWVFEGPDAKVLLSEEFARTSCYRLTDHPRDSSLLGLAFEPVSGFALPAIEGVLWVDRGTAALRRVDYTYSRLPWGTLERDLGGDLRFERLPDGRWIVSAWEIRMPELVMYVSDAGPRLHRELTPVVRSILIEGGKVAAVWNASGQVVFREEGTMLQGIVREGWSGIGVAGVEVRLTDPGGVRVAQSDTGGAFAFPALAAGGYALSADSPLFRSSGRWLTPVTVSVGADSLTEIVLQLQPPEVLRDRICGSSPDHTLVGGFVQREGSVARDVITVQLVWRHRRALPDGSLELVTSDTSVTAGVLGYYAVCVASRGSVRVTATSGPLRAPPSMIEVPVNRVIRYDPVLRP